MVVVGGYLASVTIAISCVHVGGLLIDLEEVLIVWDRLEQLGRIGMTRRDRDPESLFQKKAERYLVQFG